MQQSREIDIAIASKVLGHTVYYEKNGAVRERLSSGQSRPLRAYTEDVSAAWEVVEKMSITLLPIESGWFALVGPQRAWSSPADFLLYLQKADFVHAGAAVGEKAPLTICTAALKALQRRESEEAEEQNPTH